MKVLLAEGKEYVKTHAAATKVESGVWNYLRVQIQIHVKGFGCRLKIVQGKASVNELVSHAKALVGELEASGQAAENVPVLTFFTKRYIGQGAWDTDQAGDTASD